MTDPSSSTEATIGAFEFEAALAHVGLDRYEGRLREHGFWDWENVTRITESNMAEMDFRLGDRRKLQRMIREYTTSNAPKSGETPRSPQEQTRKRSYRRHPRPDTNAPVKPKTAYVLFGEHVRQDPVLRGLSFTDLAKETGKRWNEISGDERANEWETPAADRLQNYREELERYKQTEDYQNYQTYLEEFRQGRRNVKPTTTPSDCKALSVPESASPSWQSILHGQEGLEATHPEHFDIEEVDLQDQSQDMTPAVKSGMEEVRRISTVLGINLRLTRVAAFPQEDLATQAVEAFLRGTGSLLYFWDREEALSLVKSVYHPDKNPKPVYATEVFAMSAVGSYCDGEAHSMSLQKEFLDFFLCALVSPSNTCDLRRMRLFACLAICRFTNSVESARKLLFSALSIGRQTFTASSFRTETPEEDVHRWWNVFRSVVFLESWFAYNTSHESRVTSQDLNLYHPPRAHAEHGSGIFQERVVELGQLAAYVALDLNTASQPKAAQARVYFESLNEWHRTLPPPMQLSRLSLADPLTMNWHTKRSLLQLHILFLGLFIEPYRDCLVELGRYRLSNTPVEADDLEALKVVEGQCVLAARQSARVASLLQIDNLIRSHCWVSVYTSFTGCAILLFSASQKLLELCAEEVGHDLSYASPHLNVLSLCSCDNATARRLYTPLQIVFNDIREVMVSPVYCRMCELRIFVKDAALVPQPHYDAAEGAGEVSRTMLDITRRIMDVLQQSLSF